ncbi:MFS general substrate transporter [Karstenula rhodostoma CBS 690.94]|uniref:MFS general substrate transporter n=1 Tax=Karstenula rhodostoma CBS 690.94 TaxID=1392251 RepID=A0A9P4UCG8_9PLEO|nr:MFS general substrate transporter [Karstenula rhodostoma CBS 690.94]
MAVSGTRRNSSSASDYKEDHADAGELGGTHGVTKAQQIKLVLACALQAFWVVGINQSFGIFQAHYGSEKAFHDGIIRHEDQMQRAAIATIQSLGNGGIVAVFAMFFFPRLPLIRKHIRTLCYGGAVFTTLGFALAATCTNVWFLLLTQGLLVGIGNGVFFHVLSTILPEYFSKNAGLAQGACLACGGLGGLALSLSLPEVLEAVGSRWTLGILSVLSAFFLGISSSLAQPPRKCQDRRTKPAGWGAFKNPTFTLLLIVNLVNPLTVAIPTTFGPEFSKALGYNVRMASVILALVSVMGIPSRLLTGYAADRLGHNNVLFVATLTYALSTLVMWLPAAHANSKALWVAYNVVYGCVFGVFNTVMNSVQQGHFGDELYYSYNGALASIRGVGYLVGVPIAGALVARIEDANLHGTDFTKAIVYTGTLLMASVFCLAGVRWLDNRKNGWKWVT